MAAERVKNFNDEKPFGKISVVIADDQSMKARIMGDYLKISGFIITIANSIDE